MTWLDDHASSWEAQYRAGRYVGDPPEPFTADILRTAEELDLTSGLYIGCGNGRNFTHLVDEGLDLTGIDISAEAIRQVENRRPEMSERVLVGTVDALADGDSFELVIGIQVFMFGTRTQAHAHLAAAQRRVEPGGLLCLRANAVGTDVWPAHQMSEEHDDGRFTVIYDSGPKAGLSVHFFSMDELAGVFAGWERVLEPRIDSRMRGSGPGQWSQVEAIYRRPHLLALGFTAGSVSSHPSSAKTTTTDTPIAIEASGQSLH